MQASSPNSLTNNNLLKTLVEAHTVSVKEASLSKAITLMMYNLRRNVTANSHRIILKMEPVSFVLNKQEEVKTPSRILNALNKDNKKYLFTATIEVELKYLDVQQI